MKYALIIGGELRNKGAQAMSFISILEIRKRFPDIEPVLLSSLDAEMSSSKSKLDQYSFKIQWGNDSYAINYLSGDKNRSIYEQFKDGVKTLLHYRETRQFKSILRDTALCVDISGFAFGAKWGTSYCQYYLNRIKLISKYNVPIYILPQSFGPFVFQCKCDQKRMQREASSILPAARIIFARERQGYDDILSLCGNSEIKLKLADDLVFQSKDYDYRVLFSHEPKKHGFKPRGRAVAIVPNLRNADHGNVDTLRMLYKKLIQHLADIGYEDILLIRHASEDLEQCNEIKALFPLDQRVRILGEDRYCFEYGEIFAACDFAIASRFHSIVHAYREGVPCIALGWAVKYLELLERCGQNGLAFDVTSPGFNPDDVLAAVDRVIAEHDELSGRIKAAVAEARRHNVFDAVEEDFKSLQGGGAR